MSPESCCHTLPQCAGRPCALPLRLHGQSKLWSAAEGHEGVMHLLLLKVSCNSVRGSFALQLAVLECLHSLCRKAGRAFECPESWPLNMPAADRWPQVQGDAGPAAAVPGHPRSRWGSQKHVGHCGSAVAAARRQPWPAQLLRHQSGPRKRVSAPIGSHRTRS